MVGGSVGANLRLLDVQGWGDDRGAAQLGLALGTIVGAQAPLWRPNDLGSRLLLAVEAAPEWSFWTDPLLSAPAGADADAERLRRALAGGDAMVRLQLQLRFEL